MHGAVTFGAVLAFEDVADVDAVVSSVRGEFSVDVVCLRREEVRN